MLLALHSPTYSRQVGGMSNGIKRFETDVDCSFSVETEGELRVMFFLSHNTACGAQEGKSYNRNDLC